MKRIIQTLKAYPLTVLFVLWSLVQFLLFFRYGFVTDFEGLKYQNDAHLLMEQFLINPQRVFYASYSIVVALLLEIGIGYYAVLIFQLIVNAWASYLFFTLLAKLLNSNVALITTAFLIVNVQLQMWNFHLFTEALFISAIIIYMYVVFTFDYKVLDYIKLFLLLIFLSYLRPIGISLAIPAVFFFGVKMQKEWRVNILVVMLLIAAVIIQFFIMLALRDNFSEFYSVATKKVWIIGAYNTVDDYRQLSFLPDFLKAIFLRFVYYFSMLRPYYSLSHNLSEVLFYPVYALSLYGVFGLYKNSPSRFFFIIVTIGIFSVFTILSHVNYHGRYISPILPMFLFIAAFGIENFRTRSIG